MRYDSLATPISDAEPCGPDLDELGDDKYLNYMLGAENRLPTRYLEFKDNPDGVAFDGSKIDLKAELAAINGFLEQSRDMRLLTLEARFQALAGNIVGFSECVQTIALLVSTYWDDFNPKGMDGDFTLRQNAVGALDSKATVISALEYAPVLRDPRVGAITLRALAIARGNATPREGEAPIELNRMIDALGSTANSAAVEAMYASIAACKAAVTSIRSTFDDATGATFSPDFEMLPGVLSQLCALVELGRPDLAGSAAAAVDEPADDHEAGGDQDTDTSAAPRAARPPVSGVTAAGIPNRASASAALLAAEQYFGRHETSSPALLLVHQARMLVGQPLVVALESLLPESAEAALLVLEPEMGFQFSLTKMRAIMDDYSSTAEEIEDDPETILAFSAQSRQEAAALILGVSAFFRQSEPSSPIPMLLGKAEKFMSQNFQSILADLMPKTSS